jgi:threonine dehydratase
MSSSVNRVSSPQVQWSSIEQAAVAIDPVFTNTPVVHQQALDDEIGCRLILKVESLGPLRSFKGRGTDWCLQSIPGSNGTHIVTASAGNFGQGIAYASARHGFIATVFAAETANPGKIASMRAWGAQVELVGNDFDEAMAAAVAYSRETSSVLIVDGENPRIAEGAGTIALELSNQIENETLDSILVPMGNGALVGGVGTWIKHDRPSTRVIAVGALGAPAMARSWHSNTIVTTEGVDTIADGMAVRVPVPAALDVMRTCVDDVVEVSDTNIVEAMRLIHRHFGLVAEPAGAAGLAAILEDPETYRGQTIATILCGANINQAAAPRYLFGL